MWWRTVRQPHHTCLLPCRHTIPPATRSREVVLPVALQDVLILAAIYLLGATAVRAILKRADWLTFASLSVGVGGGLLTWVLFLLSWAGVSFGLSTVLLAYAGLLLPLTIVAWRAEPVPWNQSKPWAPQPNRLSIWMTRGTWTAILLLIGIAISLSIGLSYYTWDAIANWSVKGYGMALEGSILAGAKWGSVGLSYPMNLSMLIGLFRIFDGDLLPGSKFLFPLFYVSLLLGCYRFWRVHRLGSFEASLGTLLLASTPILFTHASTGYANLPFTVYLCLGVLWVIESMQEPDGRKTLMGSVLLALSTWTRPEGLLMSTGILAALGLVHVFSRQNRLKLMPLILPPLSVAVSWLAFARLHATGDAEAYELSSLALKGLLAGDIRWTSLAVIIRFVGGQLLRYRDWGFTLGLVGILWIVALRPKDIWRDHVKTTLFIVITVLSLIVFGAHYMAAYSPRGPAWVYEWLSLNFTRVFMPVGTLMSVLAFLAINSEPGTEVRNRPSPKQHGTSM